MIKKNLFICYFFINGCIAYGQANNTSMIEVFKQFQEGYTKRDTSMTTQFTNGLCSKEIQIIGTGDDEWIQGIDDAGVFFKNDWLYWFALSIDTSSINLTGNDNTKFFRLQATASISFPSKDAAYEFAYKRLQQIIAGEKNSKSKLLSYSSEASNLIQQIESGKLEIAYSLRISGGLAKQNGKWFFSQLVFSFPYPMARK
jgi:hypothetical protein